MSVKNNFVDYQGNDIENNLCVETDSHGLMCPEDKVKLNGIETGANKYVHPSYTAKSSGLYKVTVDSSGHVSAATAVTKSDITALGIPASDTNTTYSVATTSSNGLMSSTDKAKLDGIETGANKTVVVSTVSTSSASSVPNNTGVINYVGGIASAKMDKANPVGTGSLSMNRASSSTVGNYSTTLGYNCTASGNYCVAIGLNCVASTVTDTLNSIAIGTECTAGSGSTAIGSNCNIGDTSIGIGFNCQTTSDNAYSFLFGQNLTNSSRLSGVILGNYNSDTPTGSGTIFTLGGGSSDSNRLNVLEITGGGNIYVNSSTLETAYDTLISIDI